MTQINNLTSIESDSLSAGDLLVIFSANNSDARKASLSVLQQYMQDNLTFTANEFETQTSQPSASGFTVTITPQTDGNNVHLILTPLAGYATGTIKLPLVDSVVDKQEVLVNCTQSVTTLTVNANGASAALGAPTSLTAHAFFRMKYDIGQNTWYRVG